MEHWKVEWHHDFAEEPVVIYSEIGADGYETRKVEEFRDGSFLWADETGSTGSSALSEVPVGSIEDVRAQAEFTAFVITWEQFQDVWRRVK